MSLVSSSDPKSSEAGGKSISTPVNGNRMVSRDVSESVQAGETAMTAISKKDIKTRIALQNFKMFIPFFL